MEAREFFRVVRLRRGKMTPAEFRIRDGEKGLSLFAHVKEPGSPQVLEAVQPLTHFFRRRWREEEELGDGVPANRGCSLNWP